MKYLEFNKLCELYAADAALGKMSKKRRRIWEQDLQDVLEWSSIPEPGPMQPSHRWNFDRIPHETLVAQARFCHEDIRRIYVGLRLSAVYEAANRTKFTALDGLLIVLYRLGSPATLFALERDLRWKVAELDVIFNYMIEHVLSPIIQPLLTTRSPWLNAAHLRRSAEYIAHRFGMPVPLITAFIDGKVFRTCRPAKFQRCVWCGKDRCHGLKWQNLVDAFGLHCHFYGPCSARRHDAAVYNKSGLYNALNCALGDNQLCIYGDAAYPRSDRLLKPYLGPTTAAQRAFNKWYAILRVVVEWSFAKVVALWPLINFKPKMKILLSRVGLLVETAAFFTNCHTLLYGSQVQKYFGVPDDDLPSLELYFQ